jgi:hypothetical protein
MIELALNNLTINVKSMEYNIRRELNVNEIEQVNGGWFWGFIGGWAGGHALNWAISKDWGNSSNDWETNIAP